MQHFSNIFDLPNFGSVISEFFSDPLYSEVLDSFWLKRLFSIRFLGGLSYIEKLDRTKSRGHHSLGVAILSYYYSKVRNLKKSDERRLVVYALLHDIAHMPFSHTMDLALTQEFQDPRTYESKMVSDKLISGAAESLQETGQRYRIDIASTFVYTHLKPLPFRVTHNLDTLEGILRVYNQYLATGRESLALPKVIIGLMSSARDLRGADFSSLDAFWNIKNQVYSTVIYDDRKILFERILGYYLYEQCKKKGLLDRLHIFTDDELFNELPALHQTIEDAWQYIERNTKHVKGAFILDDSDAVNYNNLLKFVVKSRQFQVKQQYGVESQKSPSWKKRYVTTEKRAVLCLSPSAVSALEQIIDYSFSDHLNKMGRVVEDVLF